jgi:hypothetical protein
MKYNKLARYILSLLLGNTLLCGCNEQHKFAVTPELSDVIQKKVDRYVNTNGGLGEAVVNPEWRVREELRRCQDKESHLSVELKCVKKDLQSERGHSKKCRTSLRACEIAHQVSEEMQGSCQRENERCEKRFEELGQNSTTIRRHFESHIATLEKNYTEYITTLKESHADKISTVTGQRDDLITQLANNKNQAEALQGRYDVCVAAPHTEKIRNLNEEISTLTARNNDLSALLAVQLAVQKERENTLTALNHDLKNQLAFQKNYAESPQDSNYMQAALGGGFLLGAVSVGGVLWKKMSNALKKEKKKNDELEDKILETFIVNDRERLLNEGEILRARIWSSIASQNRSTHGPTSANLSLHSGFRSASVRGEGREGIGAIESLNEDQRENRSHD